MGRMKKDGRAATRGALKDVERVSRLMQDGVRKTIVRAGVSLLAWIS